MKLYLRIILTLFCALMAGPPAFANGIDFSDSQGYFGVPGDNVGIGSSAPGQKLDVQGTVRTVNFTMSGQAPISGYVLTAKDSAGDTTWSFAGGISGWTVSGNNVYETNGGNVGIGTNLLTTAALTVMNGNVGIGTWVPRAQLDVEGTLSVASFGGNVGIGTWVPRALLSVGAYAPSTYTSFDGITLENFIGMLSAENIVPYAGDNITSAQSVVGGVFHPAITSTNTINRTFDVGIFGQPTINSSAAGAKVSMTAGQFDAIRASANDLSTNANNIVEGVATIAGNNGEVSSLVTGNVYGEQNEIVNYGGTITNAYGIQNTILVGLGGEPANPVVGTYYALDLAAPTFANGGTITTDYGVYSADTAAANYFAGNVGIGSTSPGQALDVQGTVRTVNFTMSGQAPISGYVLTASDSAGDTAWSSPGGVSGWTESGNNVYETHMGNVGIGTVILTNAALTVMNGNVGIGTWIPKGQLDVEGTLSSVIFNGNVGIGTTTYQVGNGNTTPIIIKGSANYTSSTGTLLIGSPDAGGDYHALMEGYDLTNNFAWLQGGYIGNTYEPLLLNAAGGNVGIGYAVGGSPNAELQVDGPGTLSSILGSNLSLFLGTQDSTIGRDIQLGFGGHTGSTTVPVNVFGAQWTGNSASGAMDFIWASVLNGVANNTAPTERMRLTSTGNLGIGTFAVNNSLIVATGNVGIDSLAPGQALDVQGTVRTKNFTMSSQSPIVGYVLTSSDSAGDALWSPLGGVAGVSGWTVSGTNVFESNGGNVGIGTSLVTTAALAVMNGNVGIGTWVPGEALSVYENSSSNIASFLAPNNAGTANIYVNGTYGGEINLDSPASGSIFGMISNNVSDVLSIFTATSMQFQTGNYGGTNVAQFGPNANANFYGNVGIGTTLNTTSALTVMNGNVGIGTWVPSEPLDIFMNVAGANPAATNSGLIIENNAAALSSSATLTLQNDKSGFYWYLNAQNGASTSTTDEFTLGHSYNNPTFAITAAQGAYGDATAIGFDAAYTGATLTVSNGACCTPTQLVVLEGSAAGFQAGYNVTEWRAIGGVPMDVIGPSGNLGIGTSSPANQFIVNGGVGIGTGVSSSYINAVAPSGGMIVQGNVGIGTWVPAAPLTIGGGANGSITLTPGNPHTIYSTASQMWLGAVNTPQVEMGYSSLSLATSGGVFMQDISGSGLQINDNVGIGTSLISTAALTVMKGNVGIGTWVPGSSLQVNNTITFQSENNIGSQGGAFTVNWNLGNREKVTLTGATAHTATFTAPASGVSNLVLKVIQGSANNTVTWPAAVKWPSASTPTLTTINGQEDLVACYWDGTDYLCTAALNYTP